MKTAENKPVKLGKRLIKTHILLGNDPWPVKVLSSRRKVRKWPDGSYTYKSDGVEVPLYVSAGVNVDAPFVEVVKIEGPLYFKTGGECDNIDDMIRSWMSCEIDPTIFSAYLVEKGWKQSSVERNNIFIFECDKYPLRQVHFPINVQEAIDGVEAVNQAIKKMAEIEGRELLGLRLELLYRAEMAFSGKPL
jgi:hypothetical protein